MDWLSRHKYAILLLALALLLIGFPLSRGLMAAQLIYNIIYTVVFCAGMLAVVRNRQSRRLAFLLGVPTLMLNWAAYALPQLSHLPLLVVFHLLAPLFLMFVVVSVLQTIYNSDQVTADSICGAFCGYLVVGIAFAHIYCLVEATAPHSFHSTDDIRAQMQDHEQRFFLLTYFSLVTLTTVGYGEITPASELARSLCVIEAIMGQFYIAVLIADLIGKKLSHAMTSKRPAQNE